MRNKGTYNFSATLEVKKNSPLDSRMLVSSYDDLTLASTWTDNDGNSVTKFLYKGMLVSCQDKPGKVYQFVGNQETNETAYTDSSNWVEIGASASQALSEADVEKLQGLDTQSEIDAAIADAKKAGTDAQTTADTNTKSITDHLADTTNPHFVTKTQVGLSNVLNVEQIPASEKGVANGVATLDANGTVPSSQLPSYVDDVLEYTAKSGFPTTGETGKIYVDTTTNLTYRWSGTQYVEISASLALGETSSTAFAGDKGAAAYKHAVTNKGAAFTSGLYKITTNSEGHVTAAVAVTKDDLTALDLLPTASATVLGGIKVGSNLSIADGVLSADQSSADGLTAAEVAALKALADKINAGYDVVVVAKS